MLQELEGGNEEAALNFAYVSSSYPVHVHASLMPLLASQLAFAG